MSRRRTGSARLKGTTWFARVTVDKGVRRELKLSTCAATDEAKARERASLLADLAGRLRDAGQSEYSLPLLARAAARDGKTLDDVIEASHRLCARGTAKLRVGVTVRQFGEQWTSGKLHERWPDHVKLKKSAQDDKERLESYVYPVVGDRAVAALTLDDAQRVLTELPSRLSQSTRRQVAQALSRLLTLAVFPARLIGASPLPKGFVPSPGRRKALSYLFPDEDKSLMGCCAVPLARRLFYGFCAREGMRLTEATELTWAEVDLKRGAVRLDDNKTKDPRTWALDPGVVRALDAWRDRRGQPSDDKLVFDGADTDKGHAVPRFRRDLRTAGVTRAELFESSETRQPIRLHDLRATFITVSLANDKTEAWVGDRTGHKSSAMINRYRRSARLFVELDAGPLAPLDEAIPEFDPEKGKQKGKAGGGGPDGKRNDPQKASHSQVVAEAGLEPALPKKADFESGREALTGSEPGHSRDRRGSDAAKRDSSAQFFPVSEGVSPVESCPRKGLVADLARHLTEAVNVGDISSARIAHRALGELLETLSKPSADVVRLVDVDVPGCFGLPQEPRSS